jgi:hypothetical protein
MNAIFMVIINTPFWVYIVLAVVIYSAVKSSKVRTVFLKRIIFIPAFFFVLSVKSIMDFSLFNHSSAEFWLLGFAAGTVGGLFHVLMMTIRINRELKVITLPGSVIGVLVMLSIFGCKFTSGFIKVRHQDLMALNSSVLTISVMLGLCAGYLTGKTLMYLYRYKTDVNFEFSK